MNISLLPALRRVYSSRSPLLVIQLYQIAKLLFCLGRESLAEEYLRQSLSIMRLLYGPTHQLTEMMKSCTL
jgi:hypothetical protein